VSPGPPSPVRLHPKILGLISSTLYPQIDTYRKSQLGPTILQLQVCVISHKPMSWIKQGPSAVSNKFIILK
jgi:hypothetical protein